MIINTIPTAVAGLMMLLVTAAFSAEPNQNRIQTISGYVPAGSVYETGELPDGAIAIEFIGSNGQIIRSIDVTSQTGSKQFWGFMSKDGKGAIVASAQKPNSLRDPLRFREEKAVHLQWFDEAGVLKCETDTYFIPRNLSLNAKTLILSAGGFDQVELEEKYSITASTEIAQLRNVEIVALNDQCQVQLSTTVSSGYSFLRLSPNGKWLSFDDGNLYKDDSTQTSRKYAIWNLQSRQNYSVMAPSQFQSVSDDGSIRFRRYPKKRSGSKTNISSAQSVNDVEQYKWTPGMKRAQKMDSNESPGDGPR